MTYMQYGECFYFKDGIYVSNEGKGGILENDSNGDLVYTIKNGTKIHASYSHSYAQFQALITKVERPDGLIIQISYTDMGGPGKSRINTIFNNAGYRIQYDYESDSISSDYRFSVSSVAAYNAAYVSCEAILKCGLAAEWPRSYLTQTRGQFYNTRIVTSGGESWVFSGSDDPWPNFKRFNTVQLPGDSAPSISYKYCPHDPGCTVAVFTYPPSSTTINDFTISATVNGLTWTYGMFSPGGNLVIRNSTDPAGLQMQAIQRQEGFMQSFSVPGSQFNYGSNFRDLVSSEVKSTGDTLGYAYDGRANVVGISHFPVTGSNEPALSRSATYPADCTNRITCNLQTSYTDARGKTTTFEYDPVHGGMLSKTGPAVNGVSPQTRYSYIQKSAYYLDASGSLIAGSPVWLIASERYCRTSAATSTGCSLAGDEVVRNYEYAPPGVPDNLQVRGVVDIADGVTQRTCYTYDRYGNKISETSPSAALQSCT